MKTALVHDWLIDNGGAEKVLEAIYELYPCPIFTLLYKQNRFNYPDVRASALQKLPFAQSYYRSLLPLMPLAIEQFDLRGYDVVISSSHAVAKGVLTTASQHHICYCHTPMRYGWDLYHDYCGSKGLLTKMLMHYLRQWDVCSSMRIDTFVANSHYIARRINKCYRREAHVIYPPVRTDFFTYDPAIEKEPFYLTCSRFVPYKKIARIVEAFKHLPHLKLIVIGDGPERKNIRNKAGGNVELLGFQDDASLRYYMQRARAFLFMAEEDFGVLPVEAQSCGTPVIAYNKGGASETILEGISGLFYTQQSPESLAEAIAQFERRRSEFIPERIRRHAERFSLERFQNAFEALITNR